MAEAYGFEVREAGLLNGASYPDPLLKQRSCVCRSRSRRLCGGSIGQLLTRPLFELQATVPLGSAQEVGWKLLAGDSASTLVGYDREKEQLFVDRTHSRDINFSKDFPTRTTAPLQLSGNELRVRILVDRSSIEVFADAGLIAMTNLIFPPPAARRIEFYSKGGQAGAVKIERRSLRSIW
jgi:fructan beta-fructosidase